MDGMDHGSMDHGGMDHGGMDMAMPCKISMLWNWNTLDTCFIAESWHVKTTAMFAGSCIGVVLLVILLEFLRRAGKEYDRFIVRSSASPPSPNTTSTGAEGLGPSSNSSQAGDSKTAGAALACIGQPAAPIRPTMVQQSVRALLHTMQFAVAYFVMLLAMYYNGYIIICIFIGAYIGSFVFQWEPLASVGQGGQTRAGNEPTVCCG